MARASAVLAGAASLGQAQDAGGGLDALLAQNRELQAQVRAQQKTIEELNTRMADLFRASERQDRELRDLANRVDEPAVMSAGPARSHAPGGREGSIRIGGEGALAFFRTGREGRFPEGAFRADDPTLTFEAAVMKDVYFFTELRVLPRETNAEEFELGEIYVDFENVLEKWGHPGLLSVRAGRMNIPFGEEYAVRGPIANPLISHSLSDIWGVDEGIEAYGRIGPAHYIVAVQNGGVSRLRDFHRDKSVTARVGWQPARWLHVSGSAMRTGRLSAANDSLSELWFGNGFFRALGPTPSTTTFWANLFEADATARWKGGQVSAALGHVRFDDDDTRAENTRRLRYGYLEVAQQLAEQLFAAARFSAIRVPHGYPLPGWGQMGTYFFRPGVLTEELRRISVGLGYRFGAPLVLKVEYAWESGRQTTGARRDHEDFFGTQLAVRF